MANLNDLKAQAQETITKKTQPANDEVIDLPVAPEAKPIAQGVWGEILESAEYLPDNQIFMGLVGPEGTGKTGIVLDSLTDEEIANYLQTGEPMDKAGAYAIQGKGSFMISKFSDSKTNIIGLPIDELKELLRKTGYPPTSEA